MRKFLSFFILTIFFSQISFGQNSIEYYKTAKDSFEKGNIENTLINLENCQEALGGSNAKIESLKCQALVMKSDWISAAIAYTNYDRLLPSSAKYGEAYSAMLDLRKEIWNELENIEKKKKEKLENEIKEDLTIAKEQKKTEEATSNLKESKINETNEKELYAVAMQSKDIELLSLYRSEIKHSSTNLNKITTEIDKQKDPTSFLLPSIKNNDLQDFKYLISLGADVKWTNQKGESLLHLAIVHDAYKIYDELIKLNVDVEQRDQDGNTPLIKAVINNKVAFFKQLIKNNASLTTTNSFTKQAPLYYSLLDSNVVIGEIIIKNGINPNDYLVINNQNFTPLYLSVYKTKSIEYVTFLIRNGAEIDKASVDGETPLMAAVENNNFNLVNFLLNNGSNVNFQDEKKQTALHLAVRKENPEMVLYLIQRGGANKKIKDSLKNTPLGLSKSINKNLSKIIKKNKSFIDISSDYRNKNHENQYLAKVEKIKRRKSIRDGRQDRFFYTYAYDSICNYGFSVGTLNNRSIGFYFTARINDDFFASEGSNGTVDNSGKVTGGQYTDWGNDWRFNDKTKKGVLEGVIGLNKKIAYPLWLYAGAGVTYSQTYWEMDIYDNLGDYYDKGWLENTDEQKYTPIFESGIIIDIIGFNIRAGVKTEKFDKFLLTLGIGFSL